MISRELCQKIWEVIVVHVTKQENMSCILPKKFKMFAFIFCCPTPCMQGPKKYCQRQHSIANSGGDFVVASVRLWSPLFSHQIKKCQIKTDIFQRISFSESFSWLTVEVIFWHVLRTFAAFNSIIWRRFCSSFTSVMEFFLQSSKNWHL